MDSDNIIDDLSEIDEIDKPYQESWDWWEKKRLLFNIILGVSVLITILIASNFNIGIDEVIIITFFGIIVNTCYYAGFIAEAIMTYFIKDISGNHPCRILLFSLGTFCSAALISGALTHLFIIKNNPFGF